MEMEMTGMNIPMRTEPLVPIFLTTYKRLEHVKLAVEALKKNPEASESVLYVTSDGPLPGDEEAVFAVRNYVEKLQGFSRIECFFREVNDRRMNWEIRRALLDRHGALIQLEEDCISSPYFLEYMNAALRRYESDPSVFSICGYLMPYPRPMCVRMNSIAIPRFSAWGFGIWKDRNVLVRECLSRDEYSSLISSPQFVKVASNATGLDYIANLWRVVERGLFAYDLMATLEVMKRGMRCVYPGCSLVQNIGHDGSGEHCKVTDRFDVDLANSLPETFLPERSLAWELKKHAIYRSGGWKKYLHYRMRLLRGKYRLTT